MPLLTILAIPLAGAIIAAALPSNRHRPWVLPFAGAGHLFATILALGETKGTALGGWLLLDPLGKIPLIAISVLFFACSLYAPGYLRVRHDRPNRVFCSCLLLMLLAMTAVLFAHHLGLLWVAIEGTTLASLPLLYFNRTARSLEAAWKTLLICSVGIALALLGSFFLAYASLEADLPPTLLFDDLVASAGSLSKPWLRAAFVTLLVGYGTKMGLAPMHTWKPDAYGEAAGIVGALFAGGMTSCAFTAIVRIEMIARAAGDGERTGRLLVGMGIVSMVFAAVFIVRQRDFKRMLAYSSVEQMGILIIGIGIGGTALFGSLLHLLNNALTKGVLFLSSGNIHRAYGSKSTDQVRGALLRLPVSGTLLLGGFLAITGSPPFGPFVSEFTILRATIEEEHYLTATAFLGLMFVVFMGMGATVLAVVQGAPRPGDPDTGHRDSAATVLPIVLLFLLVLLLGIHIPAPLLRLLEEAAVYLESTS